MRDLTTIPVGSLLTPEESAAMVEASTLRGKDRYRVHEVTGGYQAWDHEEAEALADRNGETVFTRWEDANDLAKEYIG